MSEDQKFGTRRCSMCLSVRGAIESESRSRAKLSRLVSDDDGDYLSRRDGINWLMDQLAQGREVIPMNSECGNPCTHEDKGCKGFNFGAGGGCSGYWLKQEESPA